MRTWLTARVPAEKGERGALLALALVLLAGTVLRLVALFAQRPGFIGYFDTQSYLLAVRDGPFGDPLRPAGYPMFLDVAHFLSDSLSFALLVQHVLGLASAVLLYAAVRRLGVSRWWALLPAAVVSVCGAVVVQEHAVLSEALFMFLTAALAYAAVRSIDGRQVGWVGLAGLIAGYAATVRTVGLFVVLALAAWFLLGPYRPRTRLLRAVAFILPVAVTLLAYVMAQNQQVGYTDLSRAGGWNLYGRVGPFADCSKFTPPEGTRVLCQRTPPSRRPGPNHYIFDLKSSPAVRRFGSPLTAREDSNEKVSRFARAAILGQPTDYLHYVVVDLTRYVAPNREVGIGDGLTPEALRETLIGGPGAAQAGNIASSFYSTSGQLRRDGLLDVLRKWEEATRIEGPLLVLLLVAALAAPIATRGRERLGALLLTGLALVTAVAPVATLYYDARYAIPVFGLVAAAAAIGVSGLSRRLRLGERLSRRRVQASA